MKDIEFKKVTFEDKEIIEFYLHKYSSVCLSAFTFSTLISWKDLYFYQWTISDDTLLIKFVTTEDNKEQIFQPIGDFPITLQNKIVQYAHSLNYKMKIYGVSEIFVSKYPEFVSHFEIGKQRDMDNYVYLAEDLALLNGRDYQPKRNLIKQFETNNNWTSEPISISNVPACFEVINNIYDRDEIDKDNYLEYELKALEFVLKNYIQLRQRGILIRVDNKPVALSVYEQLNPTTCVTNFEKAIREYKGLYQLINRETAKSIFSEGYKYINRGEDLGIEGLRKAKLSYHPIKFCTSGILIFKKQNV